MKHNDKDRAGPSQRQLRVGELVRHAVTEIIARGDLPEPVFARAFVTIPEVRMSPDLKLATIFVTLHDKKDAKAVLAYVVDLWGFDVELRGVDDEDAELYRYELEPEPPVAKAG